jgi:hypothetical protein
VSDPRHNPKLNVSMHDKMKHLLNRNNLGVLDPLFGMYEKKKEDLTVTRLFRMTQQEHSLDRNSVRSVDRQQRRNRTTGFRLNGQSKSVRRDRQNQTFN